MNGLGELGSALLWLATLIGSCTAIYSALKKAIQKLFQIMTKDIHNEIARVDLENCKNYLVTFLARVERGEPVDEIEKQRFWEQYEHYSSNGGNSYIANKVEKEKATGRL